MSDSLYSYFLVPEFHIGDRVQWAICNEKKSKVHTLPDKMILHNPSKVFVPLTYEAYMDLNNYIVTKVASPLTRETLAVIGIEV